MEKRLFTSESVTEGHPDKMCDAISDAILDALMEKDPMSRVACETASCTGFVLVTGEITTNAYVDIPKIVRETVKEIGYDKSEYGFDGNTCAVMVSIDEQSSDIAMGVDKALEAKENQMSEEELEAIGAGDQGMMFGYATNETEEYMPYPISLAHKLAQQLTKVRKDGTLTYLRPDGKSQVSVEYDENDKPVRLEAVVLSTQHDPDVTQEQIHEDIKKYVFDPILPAEDSDEETQAWKEKLEEQFYTQTDENTEYTYWFYAIGEDKIAYRCREAGQSVGQEEGIDHAVAKYSWCISSLDQGKLIKASETISGDGFFFPSRLEQEEALESLEDIPNEFTENRLNKVQKTARATVGQAVAQILEVQEYPDDALCFAETADYDGNGKKETFAAIGRYDGAFGAPVCDLWFVGADGAVLEEENFAFKELEKLGSAFVLYRGYEVSGVSDMLFGVQEQGAVRLLKQMGHFELDDDGDLMAWIAGTEAAPGYYDISLRTLTEYRLEEIREKELLQYKNGKAVLKSILRQVGSDSGKIQILSGENDRIHVNLSDAEGSWYETWKVENDRLVLTDSGEGSVKEVHESGDVSGQNAVSQNSAVSDREADSISENNAAASDRTGSIDTRSVTKSGQKSENGTESPAFDFAAPDGTAKETQTEQE